MPAGRPAVTYCRKHKKAKQLNHQNRYQCATCKREADQRYQEKMRANRPAKSHVCEKHGKEKVQKVGCHGRFWYCTDCNRERQAAYRAAAETKTKPPSKQQIALELSDLGYSIQEIAQQMGCSIQQASCFRSKAALAANRREQQEHPGPTDEPYYLDAMDKKAEEVWARKVDPAYYGVRAVWHSSAIRDMEVSL